MSLICIFLVAKVAGVIARGPGPLVRDAGEYWELGGAVAGGDVLLMNEPIAYRTPGYPWLVGAIRYGFENDLFVLVVVQGALWLATVGLTAWLAMELCGADHQRRMAFWMVPALCCVMISSVVYVALVLTETLFVLTLMAHLLALARFSRRPSVIGGAVVGLTLAFSILVRPIAMHLWIADAAYLGTLWFWHRDRISEAFCLKRAIICTGLAVVVVVLCVMPWLGRNHAMFGKATLTEFVGRNLWIVTFQDGSGSGFDLPETQNAERLVNRWSAEDWQDMKHVGSWRSTWAVSDRLTESGLDDAEADRLMKAVAVDAIKSDPQAFAIDALRRTINFWRTRGDVLPMQVADMVHRVPFDDESIRRQTISQQSFSGYPVWGIKVPLIESLLVYRWSNWLAGNTFLMLLVMLAIAWMLFNRDTRPAGLWLGLVLMYFSSVTALVEIPAYRYRMVVEPIVVVALSVALTSVWKRKQPATQSLSAQL